MTNTRKPMFENAPALMTREDDRVLRKMLRDVLKPTQPTKQKPGTPEHRRALALKLAAMRTKGAQ